MQEDAIGDSYRHAYESVDPRLSAPIATAGASDGLYAPDQRQIGHLREESQPGAATGSQHHDQYEGAADRDADGASSTFGSPLPKRLLAMAVHTPASKPSNASNSELQSQENVQKRFEGIKMIMTMSKRDEGARKAVLKTLGQKFGKTAQECAKQMPRLLGL